VKTAFYDDTDAAPTCLEGTRVELLASITAWMNDQSDRKVYWLSGAVGTGKTTVAQSVAHMAKEAGFLFATFFFSRTTNDRSNYASVIPTIAYQLAMDLRCHPSICAALAADKDIHTRTIQSQAQQLLLKAIMPLALAPPQGLLIVIDALDECREDHNKVHGGELVPVLLAALKNIPFAKVFLTSRRESSIERLFENEGVASDTRPLVLHRDIPKDIIQADIELYLRGEFAKIHHVVQVNGDFPSESDVHALVQRSNGLFIYARTVVEFISGPDGSPELRLKALIADPVGPAERFERLDRLYTYILRKALRITREQSGDIELRNTLATLVLTQEELPPDSLATLSSIDKPKCTEFLQRISAILSHEPKPSEPVRLLHASFLEFILDSARCSELIFYNIDAAVDHLRVTERCLGLLNTNLRYDICGLGGPSLYNPAYNLNQQLDKHVPHHIRYSSRFWAVHWLEHIRATDSPSYVPRGLETFCTEHLLHWIELLSLTRAFHAMKVVMSALLKTILVRVKNRIGSNVA
jgi:hypothetical protein